MHLSTNGLPLLVLGSPLRASTRVVRAELQRCPPDASLILFSAYVTLACHLHAAFTSSGPPHNDSEHRNHCFALAQPKCNLHLTFKCPLESLFMCGRIPREASRITVQKVLQSGDRCKTSMMKAAVLLSLALLGAVIASGPLDTWALRVPMLRLRG